MSLASRQEEITNDRISCEALKQTINELHYLHVKKGNAICPREYLLEF
jgi:hypothetical protein